MTNLNTDTATATYLKCSACLHPCDLRVDETPGPHQIHYDPVSHCCWEPILDSNTGEVISLAKARQIERSYHEPV